MSTCKGRNCGHPMRWLETVAGKRMPVDPTPHPEGVVRIEDDGRGRVGTAAELAVWRAEGVELYMPHHVTCPDAPAYKSGGRR